MKKLVKVEVGWKYTMDNEGANIISVKFPVLSFDGDDLKKRKTWPDEKWLSHALDVFEAQRKFRPTQKDAWVQRYYE